MNKNRIRGIRCWASWQLTAKRISIKGTGCKSGGCAWKVVGLTSGDLPLVLESGLSAERSELIGRQKSAEGIVAAEVVRQRRPERRERRIGGASHE